MNSHRTLWLSLISSATILVVTPVWGQSSALTCRQMLEGQAPATSEKVPKVKRSFRLFKGTEFRKKYVQIVEDLRRGDEITLPSGAKFIIHGVLGQGDTTKVFDIGDGFALRLPINGTSKRKNFEPETAFTSITSFFKLQKELSAAGVRVVEMDERRSEPPYGVVVKKENFKFTSSEFFDQRNVVRAKLSPAEISLMEAKFIEFMTSTWRYTNIGDVFTRQIGYNGQEWVLFDFNEYEGFGHLPLRNFRQKDVIMSARTIDGEYGQDHIQQMPAPIEAAAGKKINALRAKMARSGSWFERTSYTTSNISTLLDRVTPDPLPSGFGVVFNTQDVWYRRDFQGSAPPEAKIIINNFKKVSEQAPFSVYEAITNGRLPVEVWVLKNQGENYWEHLEKLADQAEADGVPYLRGDDFIMYYKSADASLLKPVH